MISLISNLFVFSLVIGLLMFIHELGHFLACKILGIQVNQFALGFGKAVLQKKYKGTLYRLNMIPIGGYNDILGEEKESKQKGSYSSKTIGQRFFVIFAGPALNILLAILVFYIVLIIRGFYFELPAGIDVTPQFGQVENQPELGVVITQNTPQGPADQAGLIVPCLLNKVNTVAINSGEKLIQLLESSNNKSVEFICQPVELDTGFLSEAITTKITVSSTGKVGIGFNELDLSKTRILYFGKLNRFLVGWEHAYNIIQVSFGMTKQLLKQAVVQKSLSPLENLGYSPVGIYKIVKLTKNQAGALGVFELLGLISLSLGLGNLLPIPLVDGGHILFLLIEKIRGKRISPEKMGIISLVGIVIIVGMSAIFFIKDLFQFNFWENIKLLLQRIIP